MLKIIDSFKLAATKFRKRRIRLVLSLIFISISCGVLVLGVLAFQDSSKSLEEFSSEGLNGRFFATATIFKNGIHYHEVPQSVILRAEELYRQKVSEEKKIYAKNNVEYIENLTENPVVDYSGVKSLSPSAKLSRQVLEEYNDMNFPEATEAEIMAEFKKYNPKSIFNTQDVMFSKGAGYPLINGKEIELWRVGRPQDQETQDIVSYFFVFSRVSSELTNPFKVENPQISSGEIPVMIKYSKAEKFLGLKKLPNEATDREKYDRVQEIRRRANEIKISVCWRNSASLDILKKAVDSKNDKNSPVIYNSFGPCENPTIKTDKRDQFSKKLEADSQKIAKILGKFEDPKSQIYTFRVVGVFPDNDHKSFVNGIKELSDSFRVSTIDDHKLIFPQDMFEELPKETQDLFNESGEDWFMSMANARRYILEFNSVEELRKFIAKNSCDGMSCSDKKIKISSSVFSNNASVVSDVSKFAEKVIFWTFWIVILLTAFWIYVVVNRILSDSKKETAVFRAMGFSRFEISQIYLSYLVIFSGVAMILSSIFVMISTIFIKSQIEPRVSLFMVNFFELKEAKNFVVISPSPWIFAIFVPILLVGVLASLIPLLLNARRSPLKNLRSE